MAKRVKLESDKQTQDQVIKIMETRGENVGEVQRLMTVMAKLAKSEELSTLTKSDEFNLLTRVAVAFVLLALKRHAARSGKPFSSSTQLAFVFTLGYMIGLHNHDSVKVKS